MKKKWLVKILAFCIAVLFIGTGIASAFNIDESKPSNNGNIFYVGGTGEGNYTFIQDAIDNASNGDTVFVYNGTYPNYVRINKQISLIGENKNTTIIEGGWGVLVDIRASYVLVTGFTIRNCGYYYCGGITIYSYSNNNTIIDNIFIHNIVGGLMIQGYDNIIVNNSIIDNARGIGLEDVAHHNIISGNVIELNNNSGIILEFYFPASDNHIVDNIITKNSRGITIINGNNTHIEHNLITYNGCGIETFGEDPTQYKNNTCIENNTIAFNTAGIELVNANNSHIYNNNFLNNTYQGIDEYYENPTINNWDNGYPSGGNFWSDYTGSDNYSGPNQDIPGADGIGDIPYDITGSSKSKDKYPLIKPYGNKPPDSPIFFGPTNGKPGILYNYTVTTTDPNKDNVSYFIDWGDKTSTYLGLYASGEIINVSHKWSKQGVYIINVKAMDFFNYSSKWVILSVKIPVFVSSKWFYTSFINKYFNTFLNLANILKFKLLCVDNK